MHATPDAKPRPRLRDVVVRVVEGRSSRSPRGADPEDARFLCPRCDTPALAAVVEEGVGLARCDACRYEARDLLALVPVKPVGVGGLLLGTGAAAAARGVGFVAVVAALLALALVGR